MSDNDVSVKVLEGGCNATPRFVKFKAPAPQRVGVIITVRTKTQSVRGRIVESDYMGNCRMDTQIDG